MNNISLSRNEFVQKRIMNFSLVQSRFLAVHKTMKSLTDFYAYPMLFSISHIFSLQDFYGYYFAKITLYSYLDGFNSFYWDLMVWMLLYVFTLVILTRSTTKIITEVES